MFLQLKSRLPWYLFPSLLSWENTHSMICLYKSDQAVISDRKLCRKSSWWICKYTFDGFPVQQLGQRRDWYFYQWKKKETHALLKKLSIVEIVSPGTWWPWRGRRGRIRRSPSCSRTSRAPANSPESKWGNHISRDMIQTVMWSLIQRLCFNE